MLKKPLFWLFMLLSVFVLKGVFIVFLFPLFQTPDEQLHYATIQYRTEPKEKTWVIMKPEKRLNDGADISTYGFSEETIRSAQAAQFDEVKFQNENTQEFSQSNTGINEDAIIRNEWKRYVDIYPINASGTTSFYYNLGVGIERWLADESILTRFFSIRLLSVAFGAMIVLLAYLTAKKIGFTGRNSLIIAALVAFQPMFSATAAQVNIDIALILAFSLFIYAAVSLLKSGFSFRDGLLLLFSVILGFFSKGPGVVLIVATFPLIAFLAYERFKPDLHKLFWQIFLSGSFLIASVFFFVPQAYLISITNLGATSKFDSPLHSLSAYLGKTIDIDAFRSSSLSYWGNFGWLDTSIHDSVFNLIWTIEIIALIGLLLYLIPKRSLIRSMRFLDSARNDKHWAVRFISKLGITDTKEFLPQKKYIVFLLLLSLALELAIRFYDWRVFDAYAQILIGTPGRYFLPSIVAHFALLSTGLGFFCRSRVQFHWLLKTLLVLMLLLSSYSLFDIILPRYYL